MSRFLFAAMLLGLAAGAPPEAREESPPDRDPPPPPEPLPPPPPPPPRLTPEEQAKRLAAWQTAQELERKERARKEAERTLASMSPIDRARYDAAAAKRKRIADRNLRNLGRK
ncbi:MAG: hypothetical protein EPN91_10795 [Salinibacterium sp.]|nr:MAG: hypothetical protein EPN91_10795 [Salinibacterium sp.]